MLSGPGLLDLSSQGLHKLDPAWFSSEEIHTLLLDQNHIIKLEHLERNEALLQVSCVHTKRPAVVRPDVCV